MERTDERTSNSVDIIDVIKRLDNGGLVEDAREKLQSAMSDLVRYGDKKSKATLTITLTAYRVSPSQVQIAHEVKATAPKRQTTLKTFFTGEDGKLTLDDPAQLKLEEPRPA